VPAAGSRPRVRYTAARAALRRALCGFCVRRLPSSGGAPFLARLAVACERNLRELPAEQLVDLLALLVRHVRRRALLPGASTGAQRAAVPCSGAAKQIRRTEAGAVQGRWPAARLPPGSVPVWLRIDRRARLWLAPPAPPRPAERAASAAVAGRVPGGAAGGAALPRLARSLRLAAVQPGQGCGAAARLRTRMHTRNRKDQDKPIRGPPRPSSGSQQPRANPRAPRCPPGDVSVTEDFLRRVLLRLDAPMQPGAPPGSRLSATPLSAMRAGELAVLASALTLYGYVPSEDGWADELAGAVAQRAGELRPEQARGGAAAGAGGQGQRAEGCTGAASHFLPFTNFLATLCPLNALRCPPPSPPLPQPSSPTLLAPLSSLAYVLVTVTPFPPIPSFRLCLLHPAGRVAAGLAGAAGARLPRPGAARAVG
jgi:hypothetical protein